MHTRPRLVLVDARAASMPRQRREPEDRVDAELLHRAQAGAWEAWQQLVDRHVADVWAWSIEATDTEADGELVNQLVWLRLAQALPWAEVEPLGPWLHRVVLEEATRRRAARASARPALHAVGSGGRRAEPEGDA